MALHRLLILASLALETFKPPIFLLILRYVPWSPDLISFPMVLADDFESWETLVPPTLTLVMLPVVLLTPLLLSSRQSLSRLPLQSAVPTEMRLPKVLKCLGTSGPRP